LIEPERGVFVAHERRVGGDAHDPAVESEHEVEDAARIALREQDRKAGNDREHDESDPEEHEHDRVRD
jgi:hypothetical protein